MNVFTQPQHQEDIYVLANDSGKVVSFIETKERWYGKKGRQWRKITYKLVLDKIDNIHMLDFDLRYYKPNLLLKMLKWSYPAKLFKGFKEKKVTITKNVTITLHD